MKRILLGMWLLIMMLATGATACAQDVILDDVDTSVESEWMQIRIRFTMPVNYVRHFPQERGQLLQIFFTIASLDTQNISLREEIRNIAATPAMPATTVTFAPPLSLNLRRDPSSLSIRFNRPVSYDVRPGEDNRSLVIYLPIVPVEAKPSGAARNKPEVK
jgi:hypothetical protein